MSFILYQKSDNWNSITFKLTFKLLNRLLKRMLLLCGSNNLFYSITVFPGYSIAVMAYYALSDLAKALKGRWCTTLCDFDFVIMHRFLRVRIFIMPFFIYQYYLTDDHKCNSKFERICLILTLQQKNHL